MVKPDVRYTEVNAKQLAKAKSEIIVTVEGITRDFKPEYLNPFKTINPFVKTTDVNDKQ